MFKTKKIFLLLTGCLLASFLAHQLVIHKDNTIEIIDYGSLECEDSRDFYLENGELLLKLSRDNLISYTFKPIDLPDFDYDSDIYERIPPKKLNFEFFVNLFVTQDTWNSFSTLDEIVQYLNLNQEPITKNIETLKDVQVESASLGTDEYPAIYIDGELIPYTINKHQLAALLSQKLNEHITP